MKLWEKIFISTLVVFQVFFISASIYLINRSFKLNLNSEIESGISEQSRICNSLKANIYLEKIYQQQYDSSKKDTDSIINTYMNYFKGEKVFINISDKNGEKIVNEFKNSNSKNIDFPIDKVSYVIKDTDNKSYLFINRKINLNENEYSFSYIKEISYVYENQKFMFTLLIKLNIFICAALAAVMIVLSKIIVKPVNKLIKSTKEISEGNFGERVKIYTDDEIGTLGENFNNMADVIEDKIRALENMSKDKQSFIDNLTHEIRTPLTSIIGYADFLKNNECSQETETQALNYIYSEGKRMEILSSKLMDLIILKKENLDLENLNASQLLNEIRDSLIPKLEEKGIDLDIAADDLIISADKQLIKMLISNLIDNAEKASQNGSRIYLKAYMQGDSVIEVTDNGIGISKDDIEKIFEPFYMVDKSRDRHNNGAGLGLALCAKIAEIHNAKIFVYSKPEKGTTIKVCFNSIGSLF